MPVLKITHQPNSEIIATYRPVVFRCTAKIDADDYIPAAVYCDVYINNEYYKSFWKTSFINDDGVAPEYEFDIQDALQEISQHNSIDLSETNVIVKERTINNFYVVFRSYAIVDGFIEPEYPDPTEETNQGLRSKNFIAINAIIQHEENQNLIDLLKEYKHGVWDKYSFPLSKRPKGYAMTISSISFFPIITKEIPFTIGIKFHDVYEIGRIETYTEVLDSVIENENRDYKVLYIPDGLGQLSKYFPYLGFRVYDNFSVFIQNDTGDIIAETPIYKITDCDDNQISLYFINQFGEFDTINFTTSSIVSETKSPTWQRSLRYPLDKTDGGSYRMNITGNDNYNVSTEVYTEREQKWITELFLSINVWIGIGKDMIPIIVDDNKQILLKDKDRYLYRTTAGFSMSNEKITHRS